MRRPGVRDLELAAWAGGPGSDAAEVLSAWERSKETGGCPAGELGGTVSERWDFDAICSGFPCRKCRATAGPGASRDGEPGADRLRDPGDWEIPF